MCYVLPSGTSREPLVEYSVFDRLLNNIAEFKAKYSDNCSFILCGDMNARTGNLPDMITDNNNLHVPLPDDYIVDKCIPSVSQDKVVNSIGYLLLNFYKQSSLRILNGRLGNDKSVVRFTYNGHNGQSVVDYILVSNELLDTVSSFSVADQNILTDHCALHCSLLTCINESHNDDRNDHCETFHININGMMLRLILSNDCSHRMMQFYAFNSTQTSCLSPHNDNDFIDSGISKFVEKSRTLLRNKMHH